MSFSYSFHLSSKGHAVSTVTKIGQISRHNLRDYESADYDKTNIKILAGNDKSILQSVKEIYHQEFDDALKKYNAGKRMDRQIDDYLKHVSDKKSDVGAEIIIQIGDKDFWNDISKPDQKKLDGLFQKQLLELQKLVPEFKIASAVIHYDESSPHMHVVGVPVSDGFSRGLEKQVSKTRVFTPERLSMLQDKMREHAKECMLDYPDIFGNKQLADKQTGRNKDLPKQSLNEYYALEADLNKKRADLHKVDAITHLLSQKGENPIHVQNLTVPAKKSFLGHIDEPEKQGTFVADLDKEQVKALIRRSRVDDGLESVFDQTQERCNAILARAHADAKEIRAEATVERNETVAKAQEIVNQQHTIIQQARAWADALKKKYKELVDKFNELLRRKDSLEHEIAKIESSRADLEPLRKEVAELERSKRILSGELDHEITKTKFKEWRKMPSGASYSDYRNRGELIALYGDGSIRQVGSNENGGFDYKTLEDEQNGLCRVGVMMQEEHVTVPKSLLRELITKRDLDKPISKNLSNLIQQQADLQRTETRFFDHSR